MQVASRAARAPSIRSKSDAAASLARSNPGVLLSITSVGLVVLGLVMILSASSISAFAAYGSSFLFFKRQLVWALVGVAGFIAFARLDYRKLRPFAFPGLIAAAVLLAAVLVPGIGIRAGGSSRWISLGFVSFQPSELAKLALVLAAADALARKREKKLRVFSHTCFPVIPALAALTFLVMLQPDLGTSILLAVIGFGVLFVAGAPLRYVLPFALAGGSLATVAAFVEDYRRARVFAFLNPWADPLNAGYHTIQSLLALGSGGLFGVGLGASRQKWSYIPNAHTDFIFSILGEEMGLLGTLVVLGMFALLAYLGVRIARAAPDRFGLLTAAGITIWISAQALVNLGAVTAAMPVTGVPLPLVSFGGSSLVVTLVALGILVSIGRAGPRRARASASRAADA